jgi:glycosyltransferase involved in cell wall biosynthesis
MDSNMKISVVMPSFLEEYQIDQNKSASNREFKLERAIDSFLMQTHRDSELIVISDGCEKTCELINSKYESFLDEEKIKLFKIDKQPTFSGRVRAEGLARVSGELVCYLDSDDMLGPYHLGTINAHYDKSMQWMYYDDFLYDGNTKKIRTVKPDNCKIGTSSFCHLSTTAVSWQDGYGHDWKTISKLLNFKYKKMTTPEYLVCHLSAINLDF